MRLFLWSLFFWEERFGAYPECFYLCLLLPYSKSYLTGSKACAPGGNYLARKCLFFIKDNFGGAGRKEKKGWQKRSRKMLEFFFRASKQTINNYFYFTCYNSKISCFCYRSFPS